MLARCGTVFDLENKRLRLVRVLAELEDSNLWENPKKAQLLGQERVGLQSLLNTSDALEKRIQDNLEMLEWLKQSKENELLVELNQEVEESEKLLKEMEFRQMFGEEMDPNSAYLEIQAGSGGTEAQDWAAMLMRLYLHWGARHHCRTTVMELSDGEVAGIKSVTIKFDAPYAYGWLRTETGVHRLVRKSPFDSGNRRHTSFASVFVSPEIDENILIEINPADLRIDTYRASGAGGQHVNRTDSAVRITHMPTGVVVQCQNDRSQHKNKAQALKQLRAKLYEIELQKKRETQAVIEANKADITWGSQIRSYVLDASRVKDLRTGVETSDTQSVLNGDIDQFIQASLLREIKNKKKRTHETG